MTLTITDRAAAGAEWLDDYAPGWENLVDLDTLDIASGQNCTAGQVFRELADNEVMHSGFTYLTEKVEPRVVPGGYRERGVWRARHGFASGVDDPEIGLTYLEQEHEFAELTEAWAAEVTARRGEN